MTESVIAWIAFVILGLIWISARYGTSKRTGSRDVGPFRDGGATSHREIDDDEGDGDVDGDGD